MACDYHTEPIHRQVNLADIQEDADCMSINNFPGATSNGHTSTVIHPPDTGENTSSKALPDHVLCDRNRRLPQADFD